MVLNPGTLGKVNLQLVNTKDGLTAQFTITTQEARELLMKGISGLKDSLLSQGVSVDNISVKMEEQNKSDSNYDWTEQEGSRGGNKQQSSQKQQKEQEKPFEQMMFELNNDDKV
jgi:flagellar hook-length control protein FliK